MSLKRHIINSTMRITKAILPDHLHSLSERLRGTWRARMRRQFLNVKIYLKFAVDGAQLPLLADHWEIYRICHRLVWDSFGHFPNLVKPLDYNDRVQWLKLFDQSEEHVKCSDKLGVRNYVRERVGEGYLAKIFQVADSFEGLDLESLPKDFVIKANNDSGTVIIVRDKSELDRKAAQLRIQAALSNVYGWNNGEWAYAFIQPKVFVEELLNAAAGTPPADFRFHCVNGAVRWVQNDIPFEPKMKEVTLDPDGRPMKVHFSTHIIYCEEFQRPSQWDEMKFVANRLSAGWKYVRVDMFISEGRIYCGELTFYPYCGLYAGEGQRKMGQLLDFDRTTFKSPIYHKLKRPAA